MATEPALSPDRLTKQRRATRTWLIVDTCLAIPAAAVGAFMAMFAPMLFDAPGSLENPATVLFAISIVLFPIACGVGVVAGWVAFVMRRYRAAVALSLLPLICVTGAIVAIVWLQVGYSGQLGS